MIPPEPTRIDEVAAATAAIMTSGLVLTTLGMLWCSASQYRWYPAASVLLASSSVSCNASDGRVPVGTGERSSTDRGIGSLVTTNANHHPPLPIPPTRQLCAPPDKTA